MPVSIPTERSDDPTISDAPLIGLAWNLHQQVREMVLFIDPDRPQLHPYIVIAGAVDNFEFSCPVKIVLTRKQVRRAH